MDAVEHEREFLADAAHELKTPLAAIQLNAQPAAEPDGLGRPATPRGGARGGAQRGGDLADGRLERPRAVATVDFLAEAWRGALLERDGEKRARGVRRDTRMGVASIHRAIAPCGPQEHSIQLNAPFTGTVAAHGEPTG